jgi:GNAT superfamily N-acetyltransferase
MNTYRLVYLADRQDLIPQLAKLWYEQIGKHWVPASNNESAIQKFMSHCNHDKLPLMLVMLDEDKPIAMASLRIHDSDNAKLKCFSPWLGGLVVDPQYQNQGVGRKMIAAIKNEAIRHHHQALYLLTFDLSLPEWYTKLGWHTIDYDNMFGHKITIMKTNLPAN